jgi:hypothetical protein
LEELTEWPFNFISVELKIAGGVAETPGSFPQLQHTTVNKITPHVQQLIFQGFNFSLFNYQRAH